MMIKQYFSNEYPSGKTDRHTVKHIIVFYIRDQGLYIKNKQNFQWIHLSILFLTLRKIYSSLNIINSFIYIWAAVSVRFWIPLRVVCMSKKCNLRASRALQSENIEKQIPLCATDKIGAHFFMNKMLKLVKK